MKKYTISGDTIYCAALACALISLVTSLTFLNIPILVRRAFLLVGCILLIFKYIYYISSSSQVIRFNIFLLIYFLVSFISFFKTGLIQMLITPFFVLGAKDVSYKKIINTFLLVNIGILLITFMLFLVGIIPESNAVRNGHVRHSFGFSWPTDLTSMLFFLLSAELYLCIRNKGNVFIRWIPYSLCGFITYKFCDTRLGSLFILLLIPFSYFFYKYNIYKKHSILKKILPLFFLICTGMSVIIVNYYIKDPMSGLSVEMNKLSTNRLFLTRLAVLHFGYTFWGQAASYTNLKYLLNLDGFYVDSSYYSFLVNYGTAILIIIEVSYYIFVKKILKNRDYALGALLAAIAIMSIFESHFYFFQYNIFILLTLSDLEYKKEIESYEKL